MDTTMNAPLANHEQTVFRVLASEGTRGELPMNARRIELAHPPYVANSRTRLVYCNGIFVGTVAWFSGPCASPNCAHPDHPVEGWGAEAGCNDDDMQLWATPEEAAEDLVQQATEGWTR